MMAGNSFGNLFTITTWGESHGDAIGCVIDGCPAGMKIDIKEIQAEMARRSPGQSTLTTPRKESDIVDIVSGVFEGVTTGTPITMIIKNSNVKSSDYLAVKDLFRPGHADFCYSKKYGVRDYRGGGRSSARTTAAIVAGGAVAKQVLFQMFNVEVLAYTKSVLNVVSDVNPLSVTKENVESNAVRCADNDKAKEMEKIILNVKEKGDSVGGVVECVIKNLPAGIGEPVFDKLDAQLAKAMLSINAAKGFEIGDGFECTKKLGSENNDAFLSDETTATNHSGGVLGGISNGMPVVFRVAFKPTPSILIPQKTIKESTSEQIEVVTAGRHDPCVLPRAVPVVEAMTALVLCDLCLISLKDNIFKD
jgi:chorismate synthase